MATPEEETEPRIEEAIATRVPHGAGVGLNSSSSASEVLTVSTTHQGGNGIPTETAPSNEVPVIVPTKRKRGRPKASKNKPKPVEPTAKRCRPTEPVLLTQSRSIMPRRSLEQVLTDEAAAAAVPQLIQRTDAENSVPAVHSRARLPTPDDFTLPDPRLPAPTHSIATDPVTTTRRSKKASLPSVFSMYVDTLVAFSPAKEGFITQKKKYVGVGNAFLVGRVCRVLKQSLFQINWLDSQFQNHVETLNLSAVQRGNSNYRSLHGHSTGIGWGRWCAVDDGEEVRVEDDTDIL
ncbi:hypothetical protein F442_19931 [Phytophthora nicotianae P10297]|uniref:PiggyBac transposable element-derived protein domain-containing protein n=1 Tax=Phytophthora nicotianae P10297 TaxID=1317064 RepID=W2Y864_PHYNI|nr:hypothetical protein F442_19931 [Phytophthora nicotianae P10297]